MNSGGRVDTTSGAHSSNHTNDSKSTIEVEQVQLESLDQVRDSLPLYDVDENGIVQSGPYQGEVARECGEHWNDYYGSVWTIRLFTPPIPASTAKKIRNELNLGREKLHLDIDPRQIGRYCFPVDNAVVLYEATLLPYELFDEGWAPAIFLESMESTAWSFHESIRHMRDYGRGPARLSKKFSYTYKGDHELVRGLRRGAQAIKDFGLALLDGAATLALASSRARPSQLPDFK
jgi:hypothetical protein